MRAAIVVALVASFGACGAEPTDAEIEAEFRSFTADQGFDDATTDCLISYLTEVRGLTLGELRSMTDGRGTEPFTDAMLACQDSIRATP